jgi:hypothetical protein
MSKRTRTTIRRTASSLAALAALATLALPCLARDARAEGANTGTTSGEVATDVADAPRPEPARRERSLTLLGRAAIDASMYGFGGELAIDGMVRVHRVLLVGGSLAYSPEAKGLEGCSTSDYCDVRRFRAGGRAEAHAWLDGWIDPWIGAYAGVLHVERTPYGAAREGATGLEARAEGGIDLRVAGPDSTVAFGPMIQLGVAGAGEEKRLLVGLRLGLAF